MDKIKVILKEAFYYLTSKMFLKNAGIALISIFLLFILTFKLIKWYTNHGESIPTPNLKGYTLDKLPDSNVPEHQYFKFVVDDSSFYDPKLKPLEVFIQHPSAGSKVKEGRTIYLSVNPQKASLVKFPHPNDIWEQDFRNIEQRLIATGFKVEKKYESFPRAANTILKIFHEDTLVLKPTYDDVTNKWSHEIKKPKGTKVTLVVAKDGPGPVTVPDFTTNCTTFNDAREICRSYNLSINIAFAEGVTDTIGAKVTKQLPQHYSEESKIMTGSSIDVWLSPTCN